MGSCNGTNTTLLSKLGECEFDIGCLKVTNGEPLVAPLNDQLPIMYDPATNCLWHYVCEDIGWILVHCIDHYEPVLLEGDSGVATLNKCYEISDTLNTGDRLVENRISEFHGTGGLPFPLDWSFTNPTNQTGVLRVSTKMWFNRTQPLGAEITVGLEALTLGMIGLKSSTDTYPLDPDLDALDGTQSNTPHLNKDVSYDIRTLPLNNIFPFWGNWYATLCPLCEPDREVASDVSHEFVVAAGATIEISGILAIGYERALVPGEFEAGWFGIDIQYVFEGHNKL